MPERILEFLKLLLQTEVALFLLVFSGILVFAPTDLLDTLGVAPLVIQYRSSLGAIFLLCVSVLVVRMGTSVVRGVKHKYDNSRLRKAREARLHDLTPQERTILDSYFSEQTRTQELDSTDGVVNGLEHAGIIYRSSIVGELESWAYNIQPWAWDYLNAHPDLLKSS